MTCDISLTKAAVARLRQQLASEKRPAMRLAVKKAGCSGLEYVFDYADGAAENDLRYEQDGIVIYVDAPSYEMALKGLQIDYQQDLLSSAFVFNNPNKKGECGCGVSFTV